MRFIFAALALLSVGCQQRDLQLDAEREQLRAKIEALEGAVAARLPECWRLDDEANAAEAKAKATEPKNKPPEPDVNSKGFMKAVDAMARFYDSPEYKAHSAATDEHLKVLQQSIDCRKRIAPDRDAASAARERVRAIDTVQPPKAPLPAEPPEFAEAARRTEASVKAFLAEEAAAKAAQKP
jgi:hypothetical protein